MNTSNQQSDYLPDEVELVVTQEDYEAGLKRGWTDDGMLKRVVINSGGANFLRAIRS